MEYKDYRHLSRIPRTLTEEKNFELLGTPIGRYNSLIIDLIVFMSDTQLSNLFGDIWFSISDFADKMGYNRANLARKLTPEERIGVFGSLNPPVLEIPYDGKNYYHAIENAFEAALWKCAKENLMFRFPSPEGYTTYQSIQIIERFDIKYNIASEKKSKRMYSVYIANKCKEMLLNNFNLIEPTDYRKLPDRSGYRLFYLQLTKMIISIKYKLQKQENPEFKYKVDELANIFDINCSTPKNTKTKVTQILNRINAKLKSTKFHFQYINDGNRYAYTVLFTFPDETLKYFDDKLRAVFTSRLYQNCKYLYAKHRIDNNREVEKNEFLKEKIGTSKINQEFVEWFGSKEDIEAKANLYEVTFKEVFDKTPEQMGIPSGQFVL